MTENIEKNEVARDGYIRTFFKWLVEEIYWIGRVIFSAAERFYWDDGFSKSASLAYTSLFSLVPFVTLAFGIFASFALSDEYVSKVEQLIITRFVPAGHVATQLNEFLQNVRVNVADFSWPMLGFFVVSSILLINAIEYALNETWQVFEPRTWAHRIGAFSSIILITPILILSVYVLLTLRLEPILMKFGAESLHSFLHPFYNYLAPFFMMLVVFFCLYYLVPKAAVKVRPVIFGAFFSSVVFLCAYCGFAFYIESNASYEKLYGAIAAIPIFLFWLYIFWTIVLLGAEITYQAQYLPKRGKTWKRFVYSMGDGQMVLAVQALVIICRAFLKGEPIPDYIQIAEKLGCSTIMLRPTLDKLSHAGLISYGGTDEKQYTLMRSPDMITLSEVKSILFGEHNSVRYPSEMGMLFSSFAGDGDVKLTLLDLVNKSV